MFKINHLKGNTYYLKCFSNCGIYHLGGDEVVLIDSCDHKKSYTDLDKQLEERGWRVRAIYNTHGHIDHLMGNEYFKKKYGCKIYAYGKERAFAQCPSIEGAFYYSGVKVYRTKNSLTSDMDVETEFLTQEVLPDGFEFIRLPGHTFDMVGIKTPDNVWFIGDAALQPQVFESYKFPVFLFPNLAIETCRTLLPSLKGDIFVPAHEAPQEDITALALKNADLIEEKKNYIYSLADERSAEEVLQKADEELNLHLTNDKYAKVFTIIRQFITALIEDGSVDGRIEHGKMIYYHTNKE